MEKLWLLAIDIESLQNRLLKVCYVPATSAGLPRVSFFFSFLFLSLRPLTVLKKQTRQVVRAVKQSVFLDVYALLPGLRSIKNQTLCMDKLKLAGWNLGRVFHCRLGRTWIGHAIVHIIKQPTLKLKTRPKRLLGSLPLAFALPLSALESVMQCSTNYTTLAERNWTKCFSNIFSQCWAGARIKPSTMWSVMQCSIHCASTVGQHWK